MIQPSSNHQQFFLACTLVALLIGCGKSNDSQQSAGGTIAVTPFAACTAGPQNTFCDCPGGTQPMCDANVGVVCMSGQMLSQHGGIAWFEYGPNGTTFSGYGGYTHYQNIPLGRSSRRRAHSNNGNHQAIPQQCTTQIGQTCAVGTNSCGPDRFCRPVATTATLNQPNGICTR